MLPDAVQVSVYCEGWCGVVVWCVVWCGVVCGVVRYLCAGLVKGLLFRPPVQAPVSHVRLAHLTLHSLPAPSLRARSTCY
jgi:hypothetical protein